MMHAVDWTAAAGFLGVIGAWLAFAFVFYFRTKPPEARERKRDRASYWGMGLEAIGYWSVWILPRPFFSPRRSHAQDSGNCNGSANDRNFRCIGKALRGRSEKVGQTVDVRARLIEGHELITQGAYSLVRNPIYLGMFGMLWATGLAVGRWPVVIGGSIAFLIGTQIRIRSEEKLLREEFGEKFQRYARRVPAFIPGTY